MLTRPLAGSGEGHVSSVSQNKVVKSKPWILHLCLEPERPLILNNSAFLGWWKGCPGVGGGGHHGHRGQM